MNEPMDIEAVRTEALRKLGRNVVNFAKIEGALKYLLLMSQVEGNPKTISDQLRKKQTRLRKQTLGRLIEEFNKNIVSDPNQSDPTLDSSGTEMSISLKITCNNPDFLEAKKRSSPTLWLNGTG